MDIVHVRGHEKISIDSTYRSVVRVQTWDCRLQLAGEAVLVPDAGSAACLIRGHQVEVGGPCPAPQTLSEVRSWDPSAMLDRGRRRFVVTNLASYPATGRGSQAFILWRSKDGDFRLVDVLHPGRGPAVHALGGTLLDGLEGTWARSAYAPSRAQLKASGDVAGLVPPLESELTSDSDAFEDSFRRYLNEAHVAASLASTQLEDARRMQALALLEDASDPIRREQAALAETEALGELCGSDGECDPPRLEGRPTLGSLGVVIATDDPGPVAADGRADPPVLRGGVTPESGLEPGVAEPCAVLGGVEHAELSFEWRTRPDGYLARRIATGSFNYRHRALGVNLDGTAVLDCERAASPAECYADANVPYVLRQSGAVTLESFEGELHSYAMEPGVIRGGRALAAERVITNPVSGADLALMEPYLKQEFRGRPLAGQYTLIIPGRPEIQWQNLRTIQLLIDYGYWTRQR